MDGSQEINKGQEVDTRKFTALVVDDTPNVLDQTNALIKESFPNANISSFGDPKKALEFVQQGGSKDKIDIAILDFNMPGMNGKDLATNIKKTQDMKIILLTASNIAENAKTIELIKRNSGVDEVVDKVGPNDVLMGKISEHLPPPVTPKG